jgi:hypothetical protein
MSKINNSAYLINHCINRQRFYQIGLLSILFCLIALKSAVYAQLKIYPNQTPYKPQTTQYSVTKEKSNGNLPFFDDFSLPLGQPDTDLWEPNSGVSLNRTFGLNPTSLGVISFDALNQFGQPYRFSTVVEEAIGLADTLISKPIDLGGLLPVDSLYLSFYWQNEGLGERPDGIDSIRLQLKDKAGIWVTVWSQIGGQATQAFQQVMIPLKSTRYFHQNFQFKFQSFGRLSGAYDVWNIDYVYLNRNRSYQDTLVEEIATSNPPPSLLKRYTAMPMSQFLVNPTQELRDSLKATFNNLSGIGFDFIDYSCIVEDVETQTVLGVLADKIPEVVSGNATQYVMKAPLLASVIPLNRDKLTLKARFEVNTNDNASTIAGYDLRRNDTIFSTTVLKDYFAYDDGTAEYGAGINQRFGRVALKYELNSQDTLTDVKLHITKYEKDLTGQTFNLVVWKELDNLKDSVLYRVNVPIRYAGQRNIFLSVDSLKKLGDPTFKFKPLIISGTFYVGWEQTTNDRMTIGYDRNNDSSSEIFFNAGTQWAEFEPGADETGSLMIRPVFANAEVVTGVEPGKKANFKVYPNPSQGQFTIEGKNLRSIRVYNLSGKLVFEKEINDFFEKNSLDLPNLPRGMYFLHLSDTQKRHLQVKMIVNN